jgi:CheY-like chemotaxis protein
MVVLVVDDSRTVQEAVREAFAVDDGVRVLTCGDVDSAERLLARERPDVILCDVVLPGRSGYELCAVLKGRPRRERPPVLLLSGAFEPFDARRAEAAGADAVVGKPFTLPEIREAVHRWLRPQGQPKPAEAAPEARVLAGASGDEDAPPPEITEADLVDPPPGREESQSPTDRLVNRLVEPISRRLVAPVAEDLAHRLMESEPLREIARTAIASAADRLVRQRLDEIEAEASTDPGGGAGKRAG